VASTHRSSSFRQQVTADAEVICDELMIVEIRNAEPKDNAELIAVVDEWWGGRKMASKLPSLFFEHFQNTSFVATENGRIRGFVTGSQSQTSPHTAYIHVVGIDPATRASGLGRTLYGKFFEAAKLIWCTEVQCVTSPVNTKSNAFHRAMGFEVMPGFAESNGVAYTPDHDGPDGDCVRFRISLG